MIEIYCDESRQDLLLNPSAEYTFSLIGSLWMTKPIRLHLSKQIKSLRSEFNVWGEIKWCKVSPSKVEFYKRLIDLFFEFPKMPYFRCISIDTNKIDNHKWPFAIHGG